MLKSFPQTYPLNLPGPSHADIRTVSAAVIPSLGFPFLSLKDQGYALLAFARESTLACGRRVYEVWDFQKGELLGVSVPEDIHYSARRRYHHDKGMSLQEWASLPRDQRLELFQTRRLVLDLFPEVPESSSISIAERLVQQSYRGGISKSDIEEEVVRYARCHFTDFSSRIEQSRREGRLGSWEEEEVEVAVRRRLRAVLGEWMGDGVSGEAKEKFFDRNGLGDVVAKLVDGVEVEAGRSAGRGGEMVWIDGGTRIIGVVTDPREKPCRRFL